jgi:hypothetical protein
VAEANAIYEDGNYPESESICLLKGH